MKRLIKKASIKEVYHGTSSNKVDSILSSGIKVVDGGYGDGAYVTEDLNEARKYALKRAGDFRRAGKDYPKYADVYPVVLVIQIDDNELKHGLKDIYFAEVGISPDKIVEQKDISNDSAWQDLLTYIELGDRNEEGVEAYRRYYNEIATIV